VLGAATLAAWLATMLQITGRLNVPGPDLLAPIAAGVVAVLTFAVSSRSHPPRPQPRSIAGRVLALAVIVLALAAIVALVAFAWRARDWTF